MRNVLRLAGVYSKSYRLITKKNFRRYAEKRLGTYALYALAALLGGLGGLGFGLLYVAAPGTDIQAALRQSIVSFFVSLPTLAILYTLFLTMMFQLQRSGVKASIQPVYWFPVTWEEHTAASVLASTLTGTLWIAILLSSAILVVAVPTGLLPLAAFTTLCLFLCIVTMGITMEIIKILMAGISGAVMRAAGKSAVWIRFFTTLLLVTAAYIAYFAVFQSSTAAIFNAIARGQLAVWFIPYVWPGVATFAFSRGSWLETVPLTLGALLFALILFVLATRLNSRYGLSDAPTIRVSSTYETKRGLLGRLGLPPAESAIIKKDVRAFTRRSELMYIFIVPIMLVVATFMPLVMGNRASSPGSVLGNTYYYLYLTLFPAFMLAIMLGTSLVGMEGERLWFLSASPLAVKSFIRAKATFSALLCSGIVLAFGLVGYVIFAPSPRLAATGILEGLLLGWTIGMIALLCGTLGADFREIPRPRMIRVEWRLACMFISMIAGLLVLAPVLAYGIAAMLSSADANAAYLYAAWLVSGGIALAIGYVAYRISLKSADKLLYAAD